MSMVPYPHLGQHAEGEAPAWITHSHAECAKAAMGFQNLDQLIEILLLQPLQIGFVTTVPCQLWQGVFTTEIMSHA